MPGTAVTLVYMLLQHAELLKLLEPGLNLTEVWYSSVIKKKECSPQVGYQGKAVPWRAVGTAQLPGQWAQPRVPELRQRWDIILT